MWGKIPKTVKCPRGDCLHYECKPDAYPCLICTCNQHGAQYGKELKYESKDVRRIEDRERDQAGMAEQERATAPATDRAES